MKIEKIIKAFTLIEIMVGIIIVSIVLIGGFQALSAVSIGKTRLIEQTDIQKESLYFTQKLFEMIKKGGTLDYEEYFNRKVRGNDSYSSGHYDIASGFGNYGFGGSVLTTNYGGSFYYCRSGDSVQMGTGGCYNNSDLNSSGALAGTPHQRFGQYSFQYIDYNSNYDSDLGDEDGDTKIIGDDDDEHLGDGPEVFGHSDELAELYLISGDKKTRTYFRWNVETDPEGPNTGSCDINDNTNENKIKGNKCLGTIEYIVMHGKDRGMDHIQGNSDSTENDGVIDTWVIDKDFQTNNDEIAGTVELNWVKLFPDSINVSEFKIYAYPMKDLSYSWKNIEDKVNISPYVVLKMQLQPSWITRKQIKGDSKVLDFSMTVSLSEIYSQ